MTHFTEEEKLIIDMYRSNGRLITVSRIRDAMENTEDCEVQDLMQSVIDKLLCISEKEYRQLPESLIT